MVTPGRRCSGSEEHNDTFALFCKVTRGRLLYFGLWGRAEGPGGHLSFLCFLFVFLVEHIAASLGFQSVFGFYSYHSYDYDFIMIILWF